MIMLGELLKNRKSKRGRLADFHITAQIIIRLTPIIRVIFNQKQRICQ